MRLTNFLVLGLLGASAVAAEEIVVGAFSAGSPGGPIAGGWRTVTLSGVAATGAPAAKTLLDLTTDYTVVEANAQGVGELVMATDQSANTLLIAFSPNQPEAVRGGQSIVSE